MLCSFQSPNNKDLRLSNESLGLSPVISLNNSSVGVGLCLLLSPSELVFLGSSTSSHGPQQLVHPLSTQEYYHHKLLGASVNHFVGAPGQRAHSLNAELNPFSFATAAMWKCRRKV